MYSFSTVHHGNLCRYTVDNKQTKAVGIPISSNINHFYANDPVFFLSGNFKMYHTLLKPALSHQVLNKIRTKFLVSNCILALI